MKIEGLKIGNLTSRLPIIQGGMGVGVSGCNLAAAVTNEGGIGVISAAHLGYKEKDFEENALKANLRALKDHIKKAKELTKGGIIGVNLMVAMNHYSEFVKASIEAGADLIISGAGLPIDLPKLTKDSKIKIAPIISSLKAARILLKLWDKHHEATADLVVIEGPRAGGHLGFKAEAIETAQDSFDEEVTSILEEVKKYEVKYNKEIPVVVAGGVYDGGDIAKYLSLGAHGVQMATRFVATFECDASIEFKEAYVRAEKEDITIVKSPVGMPGRALNNNFVKRTKEGRILIKKCYNCIVPCDPKETPYCISEALINGAVGNLEEALIFCGDNVSRIKAIVSVKDLMAELEEDLKRA